MAPTRAAGARPVRAPAHSRARFGRGGPSIAPCRPGAWENRTRAQSRRPASICLTRPAPARRRSVRAAAAQGRASGAGRAHRRARATPDFPGSTSALSRHAPAPPRPASSPPRVSSMMRVTSQPGGHRASSACAIGPSAARPRPSAATASRHPPQRSRSHNDIQQRDPERVVRRGQNEQPMACAAGQARALHRQPQGGSRAERELRRHLQPDPAVGRRIVGDKAQAHPSSSAGAGRNSRPSSNCRTRRRFPGRHERAHRPHGAVRLLPAAEQNPANLRLLEHGEYGPQLVQRRARLGRTAGTPASGFIARARSDTPGAPWPRRGSARPPRPSGAGFTTLTGRRASALSIATRQRISSFGSPTIRGAARIPAGKSPQRAPVVVAPCGRPRIVQHCYLPHFWPEPTKPRRPPPRPLPLRPARCWPGAVPGLPPRDPGTPCRAHARRGGSPYPPLRSAGG